MTEKRFLTKDQIVSTVDIKTEEVFIPEWNGHVYVRGMTAKERAEVEAIILSKKGKEEARSAMVEARLLVVAWTIVDGNGAQLFKDVTDKRGNVTETAKDALGLKSANAVQRLFDVAMNLSKMTEKDLKDVVKNSSSAREEDSSSDSASPSDAPTQTPSSES